MAAMAEQKDGTSMWYPKRDPTNLLGNGREEGLVDYLAKHPEFASLKGSPSRVQLAIDEYCQFTFMMNVGARKAKFINDIIRNKKPQVMVELGGYIGYSAISFGDSVRSGGGSKYFSLEANEKFAGFAKYALDLAGLGSFVDVEIGNSDRSLRRLHATGQLERIDILFIDHYKPAYENDLKVCEELGLIKQGTIIIADDVDLVKKQAPGYFKYVHSSVAEKKEAAGVTHAAHPDAKNWYLDQKNGEESGAAFGNQDLIYESRFIECLDSDGKEDGLEITTCIGLA